MLRRGRGRRPRRRPASRLGRAASPARRSSCPGSTATGPGATPQTRTLRGERAGEDARQHGLRCLCGGVGREGRPGLVRGHVLDHHDDARGLAQMPRRRLRDEAGCPWRSPPGPRPSPPRSPRPPASATKPLARGVDEQLEAAELVGRPLRHERERRLPASARSPSAAPRRDHRPPLRSQARGDGGTDPTGAACDERSHCSGECKDRPRSSGQGIRITPREPKPVRMKRFRSATLAGVALRAPDDPVCAERDHSKASISPRPAFTPKTVTIRVSATHRHLDEQGSGTHQVLAVTSSRFRPHLFSPRTRPYSAYTSHEVRELQARDALHTNRRGTVVVRAGVSSMTAPAVVRYGGTRDAVRSRLRALRRVKRVNIDASSAGRRPSRASLECQEHGERRLELTGQAGHEHRVRANWKNTNSLAEQSHVTAPDAEARARACLTATASAAPRSHRQAPGRARRYVRSQADVESRQAGDVNTRPRPQLPARAGLRGVLGCKSGAAPSLASCSRQHRPHLLRAAARSAAIKA